MKGRNRMLFNCTKTVHWLYLKSSPSIRIMHELFYYQYTTEGKKEKQGCSRDKLFNSLKVIERSTFYSVYRRYITATWHVDKNRRWFLPYRNSWTYMSACISYNFKIVPFWEISTFSGDISIFHKVNDVLTFLHMLVLEDIGSCKWRVCLIPSNIFFHYKDF